MQADHTNRDGVSLTTDTATPVRQERIEQARQRLSAGEYNRPEVIETVIAKLISRIAHE